MRLLEKYIRSSNVLAIGLYTAGIPSWPGIDVPLPIFGHRPTEHRRAYMPLKWAGTRTEPATSEPIPIRPPPKAKRALSPPVEPPGEYFALCGLVVLPQISLVDSKERRVIGRLVFTYGIAPRYGFRGKF